MGHAYIDAEKLHSEIDTLDSVDMEKVRDFVGYLKSRSVRKPTHNKTEEERQVAITQALSTLQKLGTFAHITDPGEWQREIRKDRPLPGREG